MDLIEALPDGWWPVSPAEARIFEAELTREVPVGHALHGVHARCLARRRDRDDVLFALAGAGSPLAMVHLMWVVQIRNEFPRTILFESGAAFGVHARGPG